MKLSLKLCYGVGQLSDGVKQAAFSTFIFFYYNQVLGLPGSLAGLAALLALCVDAITDPMVGQWSDRLSSRWGRRHPFMLAGALPFGIAFYALFSPPEGLSEMGLFAWMLLGAIGVRLMLTLFFVPHLSLGAELATGYHQRTSLIGYRVFFTYAGILITSVAGFALFFPSSEAIGNGMLVRSNYSTFGIFCAVIATVSMLACVTGTWKTIPALRERPSATGTSPAVLAFMDVLRTTRQQSFRILFISVLVFNTLAGVIATLLVYVATYVFEFRPEQLAGLASSVLIGIMFASPVAQYLAKRFDKKNALALCVIVGGLFAFSPQVLYFSGILQSMDANLKFGSVFIVNGLSQIFFIAYIILLDSMLTDVIDEHEWLSGEREEGLYFAARSFATKASYGLGGFFAGVGLDLIEFPRAATPENVSSEAVISLAILSGPVLFLLFCATVMISTRFPLTANRHQEIMRDIADRNALKH